jgi:glycerol-3-phosphate responsive antiterminator
MAGKTMKIVLLLSYILAINSFGQTTRNQRELYADFLDGINKQNLSTKFLLNRGFINNDEIETLSQFIESYDEVKKEVIPPMSQMDAISWKQFYSSLLESDINAVKKLPGLEAINNQIINNPKYATSIPFSFLTLKENY